MVTSVVETIEIDNLDIICLVCHDTIDIGYMAVRIDKRHIHRFPLGCYPIYLTKYLQRYPETNAAKFKKIFGLSKRSYWRYRQRARNNG
jgi:hypothetical protein